MKRYRSKKVTGGPIEGFVIYGPDGKPLYDIHPKTIVQELNKLNDRIKSWHDALTPLMPLDFKDWHQNSPVEWPKITAWLITSQLDRIKELETENDVMRAELLLK